MRFACIKVEWDIGGDARPLRGQDRLQHDWPYDVLHSSDYNNWKGSFALGIAYNDDIRLQSRGLVVRTGSTGMAVFEGEKDISDEFEEKEGSCELCDTNCLGLSYNHWHIRNHRDSPEHIVLCDEAGRVFSSIMFENNTEGEIGGDIWCSQGLGKNRKKGSRRTQRKSKGILRVGGFIKMAKEGHWHGESTEGIGIEHEGRRAEQKQHSESQQSAGSSSRVLQHVKPVAFRGKGDHTELSMLQLSKAALSLFGCATHGSNGQVIGRVRARLST